MKVRPTCLPLLWQLAGLDRMESESLFHLQDCFYLCFIIDSNQESINTVINYHMSEDIRLPGKAEVSLGGDEQSTNAVP